MQGQVTKPEFVKNLDENSGAELLMNIGWENARRLGLILDERGEVIPWYCYSAVFFLKERLKTDMSIFEYGSGFSTIFYAKKVNSVISVETSEICKNWLCEHLEKMQIKNVEVFLENPDYFPTAIGKFDKKFDLIVIDSIKRNECAKSCISKLSANGVVLLDNCDRVGYHKIFELFTEFGFKNLVFRGTKPLSTKFSSSCLFYKTDNVFGL